MSTRTVVSAETISISGKGFTRLLSGSTQRSGQDRWLLTERPWEGFDIIEGGIANDRVIDTIRLYMFGNMEKSTALKRLSEHRPNHQICILNQAVADKYLKFIESMAL